MQFPIIAIILLAAVAAPTGEKSKPLEIPLKAIEKIDTKKAMAVNRLKTSHDAFLKIRGEEIEIKKSVLDFFVDCPALAGKLAYAQGVGGYEVEMENGDRFELFLGGFRAEIAPVYKKEGLRIYLFDYSSHIPLAIGLRISGEGMLVTQYKKTGDDTVSIDVDLYAKAGDLPLDPITATFGVILESFFLEKIQAGINQLGELSETIQYDPEDVWENIEEDDDFTKAELKIFRKIFISGK